MDTAPNTKTSIPDVAPSEPKAGALSLADLLIDMGLCSAQQMARERDTALREGLPLVRVLVRDGLVLSRDLSTLAALHLGLSMVDLGTQSIDRATLSLVPEEVARRYLVLPVSLENDRLAVAMTDPTDLRTLQ